MAVDLESIRATADRVARSHGLDVVDVEFQGNQKFRVLRVYLEKDEAGREQLRQRAQAGEATELPTGVPVEMLSGVTHEDCAQFAQDFGTVLDVEDLVSGTEYTLEVSSPGLERKLTRPEEFRRFQGGLVKLQTFTPVDSNRHWKGRVMSVGENGITLNLAAVKQKGKNRKLAEQRQIVEIAFSNIEKANLEAEL